MELLATVLRVIFSLGATMAVLMLVLMVWIAVVWVRRMTDENEG